MTGLELIWRLIVLCFPLRMQAVGLALEELLVTAQKQDCLTVGIYESAKLLNAWVESIKFGFTYVSCYGRTSAGFSYASENSFYPTHAGVFNSFSLSPSGTQTVWSCAFWQPTMRTMWRCRSTSPCCSPSAATAAFPSCESRELSGSSSCSVRRIPTETRRSTETSTACWLR